MLLVRVPQPGVQGDCRGHKRHCDLRDIEILTVHKVRRCGGRRHKRQCPRLERLCFGLIRKTLTLLAREARNTAWG